MKKILIQSIMWIAAFAVNFCIVYYFGTDNIGLCGSIAFIAANLSSLLIRITEGFKDMIPIFQTIDDQINQIHENINNQDDRLNELESKIVLLEDKISEIESNLN